MSLIFSSGLAILIRLCCYCAHVLRISQCAAQISRDRRNETKSFSKMFSNNVAPGWNKNKCRGCIGRSRLPRWYPSENVTVSLISARRRSQNMRSWWPQLSNVKRVDVGHISFRRLCRRMDIGPTSAGYRSDVELSSWVCFDGPNKAEIRSQMWYHSEPWVWGVGVISTRRYLTETSGNSS